MKLRPAGNTHMQELAKHPHVQAIVQALEDDWELLESAAAILREYSGRAPEGLEEALDAETLTYADLNDIVPPSVMKLMDALRTLYGQASSDEDANRKRGKVLESLVHSFIAHYYDGKSCLMDCLVSARTNAYQQVTIKEVDVCAWDIEEMAGEAYECKTKPEYIASDDCDNLVAIFRECQSYATGLRVGLVSLDHSNAVRQQRRNLAKRRPNTQDYKFIFPFGYDNLHYLERALPKPRVGDPEQSKGRLG